MEDGAIAGIVVGCVIFVVICIVVVFIVFRVFYQGRQRRRRRHGKNYFASAQSQIRRKDCSIEAVHVKRVTRCFPTNPAGDPMSISPSQINQPVGPGDVFILPDPPPPVEPRP